MRTFDVAPGNDVFRVGSTSSTVPTTSKLDTIQGRLRLIGGGVDDASLNQNLAAGNNVIFNNGAADGGFGTLRSDELLGFGMGAGISYSEMQALTLSLANGADALFIESTHSTTTTVKAGTETGPGDVINIGSISGPTSVNGEGGNDIIRVNYDGGGVQTFLSGVASLLELTGGEGSDLFEVGLAGLDTATVEIRDGGGEGNDRISIFGNDDDNLFLFRANQVADRGVVASYEVDDNLLPVDGGFIERVNYYGDIENIEVGGRGGNDTFVFDDTLSGITVRGDAGDDTFQVGQIFASARNGLNPTNGLDPLDYFETTQTTRGFLSNGVSEAAYLFGGEGNDNYTIYRNKAEIFAVGEAGDDSFLVRSFVRVDPNDPKAPFTNINGGQGADFIAFAVNAPVRIEGGDGFDTLTVVGTEFGDDFLVNEFGVFGGGLFVTYVGIEKLVIDALEGNDRFFIAGTSEGVEVEIVGGLGSDTFNVGGADGKPITVVSNSLDGNSGLIDQSIFTDSDNFSNIFLQDLSVKVADNDEAGILIIQDRGPLTLIEGIDPSLNGYLVSSYSVVLTRAPEETVGVNATPVLAGESDRLAGALGVSLGKGGQSSTSAVAYQADGTTLFFDRTNWFIPQRVHLIAPQDAVAEGRTNVQIQHTVTQGALPEDGGAYDNLPSLTVTAEVYDDDVADVLIIPLDSSDNADIRTLVFEDGSIANGTDTFGVILTRLPSGPVTVDLFDTTGQVLLNDILNTTLRDTVSLTFNAANTMQVVTITATDDDDNESRHYARIEANITSDRTDFVAVTPEDVALDFRNTITGGANVYTATLITSTQLQITGPEFTLAGTGGLTVTRVGVAGESNQFEINLTDEIAGGDLYSISVNGVTASYTVQVGTDGVPDTMAQVVNGLVLAINGGDDALGNTVTEQLPGYTATSSGETFRLVRDNSTVAFEPIVTRTDTSGAVDSETAALFAFAVFLVDLSGTGPVADGTVYSLSIVSDTGRDDLNLIYQVGSNGEPLFLDRLDIEVADNDVPQVIVDQGSGGVVVSEPSSDFFLGSGFVDITADIPFAEQSDKHNEIGNAQDVPLAFFGLADGPEGGSLPRVNIRGTGDGLADVYRISVPASALNQDAFIELRTAAGATFPTGKVELLQADGSVIQMGTDQKFQFTLAGNYYFRVTSGSPNNGFVQQGDNYQLAVYLPGIPSNVAFTGDFGVAELPETTQVHDDIQSAQNLDLGRWNRNADANIEKATDLPHITVTGSGDGADDYYSFEVTQPMIDAANLANGNTNGVEVILDLDNSYDVGDQILWRGRLVLFDKSGNVLRQGFGDSDPSLGAGPVDDTFANDYIKIQITTPQTYYISVSDAAENQGLQLG